MTIDAEALPEPVAHVIVYTNGERSVSWSEKAIGGIPNLTGLHPTPDLHAHAAKLCAAKDVEIERLKTLQNCYDSRSLYGKAKAEITTLRTVAQQALEALKTSIRVTFCDAPDWGTRLRDDAITSLDKVLKESK